MRPLVCITMVRKFKKIKKNSFWILVVRGALCCSAWAFSRCGEQGLLFAEADGLFTVVGSLVGHGLQALGLQRLWHTGSAAVPRRLERPGSALAAPGLREGVCGPSGCMAPVSSGPGIEPCRVGRQILIHCNTGESTFFYN